MDQQTTTSTSFKIRNATYDDMKMFLEWANKECWNVSEADINAFYHIDPNGFFIGELNGEPVSMVSCVVYDNYAHVGLYIAKSECRGKGYGLQIFQHAVKYGEEKVGVLGLDGVEMQKKNYEKSGFKPIDLVVRDTKKAQGERDSELLDLCDLPLDEITTYDQNSFGSSRKNYIEALLRQQGVHGFAVKKDDQIQGYGILKKTHSGYKLAPLVVDNQEAAEKIVNGLQSLIPGEDIYLDIFESNKEAENLVQSQGWTLVVAFHRMYKNGVPKFDTKKLYGNIPEVA